MPFVLRFLKNGLKRLSTNMKSYFKFVSTILLLTSVSVYADENAAVTDSTETKNSDVYDYITTPTADQIYDLQDDDNDGVVNARDLCPGTPAQARIDNDGCGTYSNSSEEKKLHILFSNNSYSINPIFSSQISEMAKFLKEYPSTSIELRGYASKVGNPKKNLILSKQRARAVESQLIDNGISANRIKIIGYGDTNLAQLGNDPIANAKNRRVTASVIGYKGEISKRWSIFTTLPRVTTY